MRSISDLLARLPIPGLQDSADRHQIAEIVARVCGVPISPRAVAVREQIATLAVPPILKSAIIVRKTEILAALSASGVGIKDIR